MTFDRRHRTAVEVDLLHADGRTIGWKVSRVFPNPASAANAVAMLERINPAGFEARAEIVVDEDGPMPGCASGVCGMD